MILIRGHAFGTSINGSVAATCWWRNKAVRRNASDGDAYRHSHDACRSHDATSRARRYGRCRSDGAGRADRRSGDRSACFDFLLSLFNFLRSGTTGLVAQAVGAEDAVEEQAIFWRAIIIAVVAGSLMILCLPIIVAVSSTFMHPTSATQEAMATYVSIRMLSAPVALINYSILGLVLGRGRGLVGLGLQVLLNGINIVLCIILGLELGWGVTGVAWATVTGETVAALVGMFIVLRHFRKDASLRPNWARIVQKQGILRMFAVNRDIMIRSFLLLTAFAFFTRAGSDLGPVTLAANAVLMNFFLVAGFFLDGMAAAAEQIVGRSIGARYSPAFVRGAKLTFVWGLVMASIIAFSCWFWRCDHRPVVQGGRCSCRSLEISALGGADRDYGIAGFPYGRRLHRRHMVARHAQHDVPVARILYGCSLCSKARDGQSRALAGSQPISVYSWRHASGDPAATLSYRIRHLITRVVRAWPIPWRPGRAMRRYWQRPRVLQQPTGRAQFQQAGSVRDRSDLYKAGRDRRLP